MLSPLVYTGNLRHPLGSIPVQLTCFLALWPAERNAKLAAFSQHLTRRWDVVQMAAAPHNT